MLARRSSETLRISWTCSAVSDSLTSKQGTRLSGEPRPQDAAAAIRVGKSARRIRPAPRPGGGAGGRVFRRRALGAVRRFAKLPIRSPPRPCGASARLFRVLTADWGAILRSLRLQCAPGPGPDGVSRPLRAARSPPCGVPAPSSHRMAACAARPPNRLWPIRHAARSRRRAVARGERVGGVSVGPAGAAAPRVIRRLACGADMIGAANRHLDSCNNVTAVVSRIGKGPFHCT